MRYSFTKPKRAIPLVNTIRRRSTPLSIAKALGRQFTKIDAALGGSKQTASNNRFGPKGVEFDDFTASGAARRNMDVVVEVLENNDIDFFLVRGLSPNRLRVALKESDRHRFKKAILGTSQDRLEHVYIGYKVIQESGLEKFIKYHVCDTDKTTELLDSSTVVRFWQNYKGANGKIIGGKLYGCDVEYWREGDTFRKENREDIKIANELGITDMNALKGGLVAPQINKVTRWVPKSELKKVKMRIGKKDYPTLAIFNKKLVDDIEFPIDVVYTWVDANDDAWREKYIFYRNKLKNNHANNTLSRYTNRDELKYSLRSLHMYAPFVRNIYIVTDGQQPTWLNLKAKNIKVVDHKEIFKNKSGLPVFNSHAINTQLHHIKGLSEHYVYFNDDVFVGRSITPDLFFTASGLAKVVLSTAQFGVGDAMLYDAAPSSAGKNARLNLERSYGRYITNKIRHIPHPQLREVASLLEEKYAADYLRTSHSRFRNIRDLEFAGSLHLYYALIKGKAVEAKYETTTINISHRDAAHRLQNLLEKRDVSSFCLNESETPLEQADMVTSMVSEFLEDYFPTPSPWEK